MTMTLYDLYLDNQVEGYLVFKTLAKQKVIEMTDYQYHKKLKISKDDLQPKGSCLSFPLQNNFEDVIHILESHTGDSKIMNPTFHTSVRRPVEMFHLYTRIPMILFGTTQTNQSFIMRDNIRNSQTVLDIYFQNGESYYYMDNQVYELKEKNLFSKYYKDFDLNKQDMM